jgi:hypothetical protein
VKISDIPVRMVNGLIYQMRKVRLLLPGSNTSRPRKVTENEMLVNYPAKRHDTEG